MPIHHRTCNLCEAMCGLEIAYEAKTVISIKGDKADPFSRGHICPKAVALKDIYEDPDRLKRPVKKTADGWQEISWTEALATVATKFKEIQAQYGHNALAAYNGNPSIHNLGTQANISGFLKALKTKNIYSATSTDQLPHHYASQYLYGHPLLVPVPDIDHTDCMVIFGGNPLASNGSMMSVPDVAHRLGAIQQRGGRVIVIDPRRTETAAVADQYFQIKPGTDVLLLLAMLHVVFRDGHAIPAHYVDGVNELEALVKDYTPAFCAPQTGLSESAIEGLVSTIVSYKKRLIYGRVGVSTQAFGGLCHWLINSLNIVLGNLDSIGGVLFTKPAFDILAKSTYSEKFGRWVSRVRQLPEALGELPVATLAEEIATPGEGQIKALVVNCGNPVLSAPNGPLLERSLAGLDFMVAIDIYINETTCHADIILPPATGLEVSHYDITFHMLAVRNTAKYAPPLFEKDPGAKYDHEILQALTHLLNSSSEPFTAEAPEVKLAQGLKYGPYAIDFNSLKEQPHGIDLGALEASLPERLISPDKRINLMHDAFTKDIPRLKKWIAGLSAEEGSFVLIGRRHLRDNNSWMHNAQRLVKGPNRCTLQMNPADAKNLDLINDSLVKVTSRVGSVQIPLEVTDTIGPGVVCMPHGYGHHRKGTKINIAEAHAGVSINDLTDHALIDELMGTAAFSNVQVMVAKILN